MSARDLSYYADLVGEGGTVHFNNSIPLAAEDLNKLQQHWPKVQELDFAGTARPCKFNTLLVHGHIQEHQIVLDRLKSLLRADALVMWTIQAAQDATEPAELQFSQTVQALRLCGLKPKEQITLEPYFSNSAVIVAQCDRNWPE